MTIVMDMSGYEIEREAVAVGEYGDEILHAGWMPQLELVSESIREPSLLPGLAEADIDTFLNKMYLYQR
jgi:hypothetical protein